MTLASRMLMLVAAAVLAGGTMTAAASPEKPIVTFSAHAVNLDAPAGRSTGLLQMQITRWSTDAERDELMTTIIEDGPTKMLDVLSKLPPVGSIRSPHGVGYNLRYARRTQVGTSEQIVIITDRPLGFLERRQIDRTTEYPFTVIELRVPPTGPGDGKWSVATKVLADAVTRTLELENYNIAPLLLQNVRREQ